MSAFDICEGSHLEFAAAESAALQPTQWERWTAQVEKAIGHSLDGDNSVDAMVAGNADGYSLDDAYEAFEDGDTVAEYAAHVIANRSITHRFAEPQA